MFARPPSHARYRILAATLLASAVATLAMACGTSSNTATGPTPVKCQVALSMASGTVAASGGNGTIVVTTQPECSWTALVDVGWITGLSPAAGQGNGQVAFQVPANPQLTARQADVVINDSRLTIRQEAASCSFTLAPLAQSMAAAGEPGSATITAAPGCAWTATSNAAWISLTSPASGSGNGTVSFTVSPNTGVERTGTLTIAGQTLTVVQAAATTGTACTYVIAPTTQTLGASGGLTSVAVSTATGCAWTSTSTTPWVTITVGLVGNGNGTVGMTVASNSGAARTATLTIAGQPFTITQSAATGTVPCSFSISPTNQSVGAAGGPGTPVTVSTSAGCAWTATSNAPWVTIQSGATGIGGGTVSFSVSPNSGGDRTGTLTIATQTFTVNQSATPPPTTCTFSISPTHGSVGVSADQGPIITVSTGPTCGWTASSNSSWLSITSGASSTGSGTVTFNVAANPGGERSGSLTIARITFNVTQTTAPCAYSLQPTSQSVPATAGAGAAVTVTTSSHCSWSATSNDPWLTVTSGASGTGSGTVGFAVAANTGLQRVGTLTIAGITFNVTQTTAPCAYSLQPTSQSVPATAAAGAAVAVTTSSHCSWSATSNDPWLTVTSGASGTGSGSVGFAVAANTGAQRVGTLTIAGETFTVTQAGGCSIGLKPTSASIGSGASTGPVGVSAGPGCTWTAVSGDPSWLTITSGGSGSGDGTVNYSAAANTGAERKGALTIGGQTFTVMQATGCSIALKPTSASIGSGASTGAVGVSGGPGCTWTAVSGDPSWLTITSGGSGSGDGTVNYSAAANTAAERTAALTIGGVTFTVTQAAAVCTYSINPASQSIGVNGGSGAQISVDVSPSNCAWTARSNDSWLTITQGENGNGNVRFTAAANSGPQRVGTLTIAGHTHTVTQAGCTYSINPMSQSVGVAAGSGSVSVTTNGTACTWAATSQSLPWLTITPPTSGTGGGSLNFSYTANTGLQTSQRVGTLTIAGQTFTLTQAGCTYSINPTSRSIIALGGTGSVSVTTTAECTWTATSNDPSWLTITSTSGTSVNYSVAVHVGTSSRTGTLTIAGQTFTVTQAGVTF